MNYSLARNADVRTAIMNAIQKAISAREVLSRVEISTEAPGNIWDLGTWMYEDSTHHLPTTWRTEIVQKDLHLRDVPTFNFYKRIVEILQGAVLKGTPGVEFGIEGDKGITREERDTDALIVQAEDALRQAGMGIPPAIGESASGGMEQDSDLNAAEQQQKDVVEYLNREWVEMSEDSRLLSELDLSVAHSCNYGFGWLSLQAGMDGKEYVRETHPQLVIYDPVAERVQDLTWVAKILVRPWTGKTAKSSRDVTIDGAWPASVTGRPESSEIQVEVWIKKGARFAGRVWRDHGMHLVMKSGSGTPLVSESEWDIPYLPMVPVILLPGERLRGDVLSKMLWQTQVRVDKTLGVLLSRVSRAAGEKYHVKRGGGATSKGAVLSETGTQNLEHPGAQIIYEEAPIEMLDAPQVPRDLVDLFHDAVRDMERIAGISQAFQGIAPKSITAGVAIQTLAEQSSQRVNRMATHMAEALKQYAQMWAAYKLAKAGHVMPPGVRVKVSLAVQEEENQRSQFQKMSDIANIWDKLPAEMLEILVDAIPGLSPANKDRLRDAIQQRKDEDEAPPPQLPQMEQGGMPGAPQLPAPAPEGNAAPPGQAAVPAPAMGMFPTAEPAPMTADGAPPYPRAVPDFLKR